MKYVALLRGINVGGNRKVDMKKLKYLFESMGYTSVTTYLNSGNVLFESTFNQIELQNTIPKKLKAKFGFEIKTLVKTKAQIQKIASSIPKNWKNDSEEKSDVAYLFPEIDSKKILDDLPMKDEFINIKYVCGAIMWNIKRIDLNKSQLNKLIGTKVYQLMTVRNVNTARFLASEEKE